MKLLRLPVIANIFAACLILAASASAIAAEPVVTTVPGDANNPTIRHPIISGRAVTLKGAVDAASVGATWSWDPGDGSAPYTGTVGATHWAVWAEHTYTGNSGDFVTATLTVDNSVDPVGTATFSMVLRADTVPNRANAAIAEALWYMHRNQRRFLGDELAVEGQPGSTIPMGSWAYADYAGILTVSSQGSTVNAFEAKGHREDGSPDNPYTETVDRGLKYLFARLGTDNLTLQTLNGLGGAARSDDADTNGNGIGVSLDGLTVAGVNGGSDEPYQLGTIIDGIVASGTPDAVATTGPANVIGRTYGDIVQDMVDWYAWAQSDSVDHGGWEYSAFNNSVGSQDNSASGWAATGLVAAQDLFGATIPDWVITRNENGLEFSDNESDNVDNLSGGDGIHGYRNPSPLWGPYSVTGAALVQMSMDQVEATTSATPDERWVRAENFFRRNFDNLAGTNPFKNYYYAMFNFSKAMRTAKPEPVTIIGTQVGAAEGGIGCGPSAGCAANGPQPLDWYNDPVSGLAQNVINFQTSTGAQIGRFLPRGNAIVGESLQEKQIQPWGVQILIRTLAQAGPIAIGNASPNPAGENFPITLDHSESFHQDPQRSITLFEWDIDNDGTYDLSSTEANPDPALSVPGGFDCAAVGGIPCSKTIGIRVTDDSAPPLTATDVVVLDLTVPPHAPTADTGGPYSVCVNDILTVDGSASFDIDEGQSEAGATDTDRITAYEWELDGVSPFDYAEASGITADATFATVGVASIGLRVTDNSLLAFPSGAVADLTDTDNTSVVVTDCVAADLAVTTSADTQVIIPDQVTLTATVSNGGPDDAPGLTAMAYLSPFVNIVSITPSQGTCVATGAVVNGLTEYECEIGDLSAGSSVDIVVVFDAVSEGTVDFEFSVDIETNQFLQLSDPNPGNNTLSVSFSLIEEIIVIVKGKGAGSAGLLEILVLFGCAAAILLIRRRKMSATTLTAVVAASLILVLGTASTPALADDDTTEGIYVGAAIGSVSSDISAPSFARGLGDAGYDVSDVSLGDSSTGWKLTVGYMMNENVGVQASYIDLGELDVRYTASVPPDEIDAMLQLGASLLPGRGRGFLGDIVLQYPFSERIAVYGTLGVFFAEPTSNQFVESGATGSASRKDNDSSFAGSIGVSIAVGERSTIRVGYESYKIDDESVDFPMVAFHYGFGRGD